LRGPSVLATAASVPFVAHLGARLVSPRAGLIAAIGFALSGSVGLYAQSARTYALTSLLCLVTVTATVAELNRPARRNRIAVAVFGVLAVFGHLFAALLVLGVLAALRFTAPLVARRLVVPGAIIGALAVAIGLLVSRHNEGQELVEFDRAAVSDAVSILTGRAGAIGAAAIGALAAVGAVMLLRQSRPVPPASGIVLAMAGSQAVGLLALSALQPALLGRFLLPSVPGVVILAAVVLDRLWERKRMVGVVACACALPFAGLGLARWRFDTVVEDWRSVGDLLATESRSGDVVFFANDSVRLFTEFDHAHMTAVDVWPEPRFPAGPWGDFATGDQTYRSPSDSDFAAARDDARVWVVTGESHDATDSITRATTLLSTSHTVSSVRRFDGGIVVVLFSHR
jgi:hypothetical protein